MYRLLGSPTPLLLHIAHDASTFCRKLVDISQPACRVSRQVEAPGYRDSYIDGHLLRRV